MIFLELDQPPPTTTIANKQTNKQTWPTSLHHHHCPPGGDGPGCRGHQTDSEKGELALTIGVELTPRKKWKWKSEWSFSFGTYPKKSKLGFSYGERNSREKDERCLHSWSSQWAVGVKLRACTRSQTSQGRLPFIENYIFSSQSMNMIPVCDFWASHWSLVKVRVTK